MVFHLRVNRTRKWVALVGVSVLILALFSSAYAQPVTAKDIFVNAGGPGFNTTPKTLPCTSTSNCSGYLSGAVTAVNKSTLKIANSSYFNTWYQTQLQGDIHFAIPVSSGKYSVQLAFAETEGLAAGSRVFSVSVEGGSYVLSNFDVSAAAGGPARAITREATKNVSDGVLNIDFKSVKAKAVVNALLVQRVGDLPATTATTGPTTSPTTASTAPTTATTATTVPPTNSCAGVTVNPGENIQSKIDANPVNTTFCLNPGTYRGQNLSPKTGNRFIGKGTTASAVVLNGSNLISNPVASGTLFYAPNQTQQGGQSGYCAPEAPVCNRPEILYFDSKPLAGVDALSKVKAGTFYFDYAADRVYFADNPAGHTVEVGTTFRAFNRGSANVTLNNMTVEKYANAGQQGTIETDSNWIVDNVTVQLNGGQGITMFGANPILKNSRVLRNGQIGVGANGIVDGNSDYGHAVNAVFVDKTEIAYNNSNNYEMGWEAGGTKFWGTKNSVISNNWVHHNNGPGLWADGFNENTTYSGNLIEDNVQNGIFHEISGSAKILDNRIYRNGWVNGKQQDGSNAIQTCWTAICISSGKNVEIARNDVKDNGRGLVIVDDPHYPDPSYGLNVHDNTFTNNGDQAVAMSIPAYQAVGGKITNFTFDNNRYSLGSLFGFSGAARSWTEWRNAGFDPHGSMN